MIYNIYCGFVVVV